MKTLAELNEKRIEKQNNFFDELEKKVDIDFNYFIQDNILEDVEELNTILGDNNAFDCEVIYFSVAIEYLSENDPSLNESLSIASEFGYTPENLNSEILASLLKSQNLREEFSEVEEEIEEFIEELKEWFEEKEEEIEENE